MSKYATEFIGTFFLVLAIGCAVAPGTGGLVPPLAICGVLMAMIYAGGHISGAHYNPAVTLAFWMRGRCAPRDIAPYVVAQLAGALAAAGVTGFLVGPTTTMTLASTPKAWIAEVLFTFALVFVIMNVATARGTANNSYYGFAIGMTVLAAILTVGDISGAALNPAVAVGAGVMGLFDLGQIWIHISGSIVGAVAGTLAFKLLNPPDDSHPIPREGQPA